MFKIRFHSSMHISTIKLLTVLGMTFFLLVFGLAPVHAQTRAQIKNVNFEMINNEVVITYDIVKFKTDEMFKIWLKVYTAQENELKAESLTGAIGENVAGGERKKIIWNPLKDGVHLNNDIYIQIYASSMAEAKTSDASDVSMGKWLLLSAMYPGLGNAKVSKNKIWLAAGALGYGCMIGSVLMNSQAAANYDKYLLSKEIEPRNDFYDAAKSKKQLSTILFVTGTVIWAVDLAVFAISARKSGSSSSAINKKPVYLGYSNEAIEGNATQRLVLKMTF